MRQLTLTLRQVFWVACACVCLLPHAAAAAERSVPVDFDGDGQHDQVLVVHGAPSVVRVWLSASNTTQLIRSRVALEQVLAVDLDGDHRPELVARDSDSRLRVWRHNGKRFHTYRPRDVAPRTLRRPNHRSIGDNDSEPSDVSTSSTVAPFALTLCASPRAPGPVESLACAIHRAPAYRSLTAVDPFAPRPPPALVLS